MTKKNLIIIIILLSIIDVAAAGWYTARRIEANGKSQSLFGQRDEDEAIAMADTMITSNQADVFDTMQHNTYYFIAKTPTVPTDPSSCCTSIKHVKVRWPKKINGVDEPSELNKELIKKAFGSAHSDMKDARYKFLNTPKFNKPVGNDYRTLVKAPRIVPIYGNVSQVLVYPYMTSHQLLVMEIDKVEYDGSTTDESSSYVHYDRMNQRVLSRIDILTADATKETELLKTINKKIDELNRGRSDSKQLQHALNVPSEICCSQKGILFQFRQGAISSDPIEILIDYGKLSPYFTKDFDKMVAENEGYWIYKDQLKAEPINESKPVVKAKEVKPSKKKYQKSKYNKYNKKFKSGRTKKRRYSGAKRRSGYRNYSGKRHSYRHRR